MNAGETIGPYRVTGVLGTGGMGDVFRAVRADDQYRADVAIKVMRADVRNERAERRFRTERQILAKLDHRNIARLLDGGTTAAGLPYVVMELVNGEPIDRYCDERPLDVRTRVQLFLQVCAAVGYAHQHLVVHRDLKPGNIFVTADGSVKLLDFGIAKLIEPDTVSPAGGNATVTQLRAMTLDYASPEQLSGGIVTTASDVYSLGVVLYRLLTGQIPYGARINDAQRVAEILSDTQPTRPSRVKPLDADLDHILLMALRKEPARRYASVEQFAADLRNYLGGLPVLARSGTRSYRLRKLASRYKVPVAAGVLIAASLIGGLGFTLRKAREADAQRVMAQRNFDSVRSLANKLFEFHDAIVPIAGSLKAREDLVRTSLEYLDALYRDSGNDPALRQELGDGYRRIALIQSSDLESSLGDTQGAAKSYERAIALLAPVVSMQPGNDRAAVLLGKTYAQQTRLFLTTSGTGPARALAQKAIDLLEPRHAGFADDFERMSLLNTLYFTQVGIIGNEAEARKDWADVEVAVQLLNKMVVNAEKYQREHPDEKRANVALSSTYHNVAVATDPRLPRAEATRRTVELLRREIEIEEKLLAAEPADFARESSIAKSRYNIAEALSGNEQLAAAAQEYRAAAPTLAKAAADPRDARANVILGMNTVGLATSLIGMDLPNEALPLLASAEETFEQQRRGGNDTLQVKFMLANVDILRGWANMRLAEDPRTPVAQRVAYWRKARDLTARGLPVYEQVNEQYPLVDSEKRSWDEAVAHLKKAEAALKDSGNWH